MNNKFKVLAIKRHRFGTDGKGITSLIGLSHCPLQCKYCLNKNIIKKDIYKEYSSEELIKEIINDYCYFVATGGGITFGGGEPLLHAKQIKDFATKLPPNINITLETSLNVSNNLLKIVFPYINYFIIDVKSMNKEVYKNYTKTNIDNLLINLNYIVENNYQNNCLIRLPFILDFNNQEDIEHSKQILQKMGFENFDIFDYKTNI